MKNFYLEFGSENNKKKYMIKKVVGSDAYNLWHLAVRLKEKYNLITLLQKKTSFDKIPRKQKFFLFFLCYEISKTNRILELGSSSLEIIEGVNLVSKVLKKKTLPRNTIYSGVEIDNAMNLLGYQISKNFYKNITTFNKLNKFFKFYKYKKKFFFHDLGVSMYNFQNAKEFASNLNRFDSGYIKVVFSKGKTKKLNPSGKTAYAFSIKEVIKYLKKPIYIVMKENPNNWDMISNKNKDRFIFGYFYFGNRIVQLKKSINYYSKFNLKIKNYIKKNILFKELN